MQKPNFETLLPTQLLAKTSLMRQWTQCLLIFRPIKVSTGSYNFGLKIRGNHSQKFTSAWNFNKYKQLLRNECCMWLYIFVCNRWRMYLMNDLPGDPARVRATSHSCPHAPNSKLSATIFNEWVAFDVNTIWNCSEDVLKCRRIL